MKMKLESFANTILTISNVVQCLIPVLYLILIMIILE